MAITIDDLLRLVPRLADPRMAALQAALRHEPASPALRLWVRELCAEAGRHARGADAWAELAFHLADCDTLAARLAAPDNARTLLGGTPGVQPIQALRTSLEKFLRDQARAQRAAEAGRTEHMQRVLDTLRTILDRIERDPADRELTLAPRWYLTEPGLARILAVIPVLYPTDRNLPRRAPTLRCYLDALRPRLAPLDDLEASPGLHRELNEALEAEREPSYLAEKAEALGIALGPAGQARLLEAMRRCLEALEPVPRAVLLLDHRDLVQGAVAFLSPEALMRTHGLTPATLRRTRAEAHEAMAGCLQGKPPRAAG